MKRGDVVTLIHPEKPNASIVKRIVALEGDVIKYVDSACVCCFDVAKSVWFVPMSYLSF